MAGPVSYGTLRGKKAISLPDEHVRHSASCSSCETFTEDDTDTAKYALRILHVSVRTSTADPFGAVRHAILRCTAGLVPTTVDFRKLKEKHLPRLYGYEIVGVQTVTEKDIGSMKFDISENEVNGRGVNLVFCVYLVVSDADRSPGMVTVPTGNEENKYRRVGLVHIMS